MRYAPSAGDDGRAGGENGRAGGDAYERLRARGAAALAAGDTAAAIDAFGDAVCLRPDLVTAHLALGECFQRLGRTEIARRIYEHAGRTDPASPLTAAALAGLPAKPHARHAFDVGQVVRSADNTYRVLERRMGAHGAVSIVEPAGRSSFFDRVGYRRYVLKTFNIPRPWSDDDRERFANEAKTWVLLDRHPHIVTALWVERVEHHHCLLLEYVDGGDLATAVAAAPLGLERALRLGLQFCDGMEYAARTLGIVHGDVKAANCLLTADGTLKVTDFGLAQVFGPAQAVGGRLLELKPRVRALYMVPGGTRNYRAPEQSVFGARVDVRTDVYGFGVLLYQMVTGDLPVSGSIAAEHIRARADTDDFPAGLRELILACVETEPGRRPRSFRALRGELQAVYEIAAGRTAPPPARPLPGDRDLYIRRGAALDELGRHDEALAWFDKALHVAPGDGWALHNKAITLIALGRPDEALTCLDQALARYPGYSQALGAKAKLLMSLGRHREALDCVAEARKAPNLTGPGYLADALGFLADGTLKNMGFPGTLAPAAESGPAPAADPAPAPGPAPAAGPDSAAGSDSTTGPDSATGPGSPAGSRPAAGSAPAAGPASPAGAASPARSAGAPGAAPSRPSPGVLLVWQLAAVEAKVGHAAEISPAHLLLGVCKLGDPHGPGADAVLRALPAARDEIVALRGRFREVGLDATSFRRRLRAAAAHAARGAGGTGDGVMHRSPAARGVFRRAGELGAADGAAVDLAALLRALLELPDPLWSGPAAELGATGRLRELLGDEGGAR